MICILCSASLNFRLNSSKCYRCKTNKLKALTFVLFFLKTTKMYSSIIIHNLLLKLNLSSAIKSSLLNNMRLQSFLYRGGGGGGGWGWGWVWGLGILLFTNIFENFLDLCSFPELLLNSKKTVS